MRNTQCSRTGTLEFHNRIRRDLVRWKEDVATHTLRAITTALDEYEDAYIEGDQDRLNYLERVIHEAYAHAVIEVAQARFRRFVRDPVMKGSVRTDTRRVQEDITLEADYEIIED